MIDLDIQMSLKGHQFLKRVEDDLTMHQFSRWFTSAYTDTADFYELDEEDQKALRGILDEMKVVLKNAVTQYFYGE